MTKEKITSQITSPQDELEILKKHFPHCFDKNGDFDFDKFKKELQDKEIDFSKESYGMDWLGKSYARLLASDPATTLLKEDIEWNSKEENKNSENLLLKGDNLEVLKHLSNAYHEKIKMIYIDPPYNTGSDGFVYEDDRTFTVPEFSKLAGVDTEQAKKILSFVNAKSNSHSAWLTFMYPRLYIAKQLLKDDGVIFVSIDDNEVAQLRILMDEIFGEENFVQNFMWLHGKGKKDKNSRTLQQYILCYSINKNKLEPWSILKGKNYQFQNPDQDPQGDWFSGSISFNEDRSNKTHENYYKIKSPSGIIWERQWQFSFKEMQEHIKKNNIYWGTSPEFSNVPRLKIRPTDEEELIPENIIENVGTTKSADTYLNSLFGIDKIFSYPKTPELISHIVKLSTNSNDLILDFFAGSGTTGDAIMQLNAEDKANGKEGNRKYILVQLPEIIDSKTSRTAYDFVKNDLAAQHPTIFDITKERLIRAAKKIQAEVKDKETLKDIDFGFKIFETTPIWENYELEADEFDAQATLFDESKLTAEDIQTLLTTWKSYDGIPLTESLEIIDLGGYTGYYSTNKLYLMDKGFGTQNLKKIIEKIDTDTSFSPSIIIAFGYHFESKVLREIAENTKSYANKKHIDIDFVVRY